ncbi:DEAD/DEAH box helicase [Sphaerisporangium album]|nr:DEAD/DEAH box helicase [Sphaerisporangium album]
MNTTTLWPHQQDAVDAVLNEIAPGGRALAVLACGTGKTRIGAEVSRRIGTRRALVLVPTLELLAQTARAYVAHLGAETGMIVAVCSDPGVMVHTTRINASLGSLTAGITTDPVVLADMMSRWHHMTVFCTFQSQGVIAEAHTRGAPAWDLIVVDEAHLSAGRAGKKWSDVTRDDAIPGSRRAFLTATPRIMDVDDDDAVSMDNPQIFGREVYRLPFGQAMHKGLLADYQVVVPLVHTDEVRQVLRGDRVLAIGSKSVPAEMVAGQIALLKAARRYRLSRVITYHSRVAGAVKFATTLPDVARLLPEDDRPAAVQAAFVSGAMSLDTRHRVLEQLVHPGDTTMVVANARVLGLGVDVPELDAIMFADTRSSTVDIVQAIGRVVRLGKNPGKTGTIIVPIILSDGETPQAALEGSAFQPVWQVLRALRAHDERVTDWLDSTRSDLINGSSEQQEASQRPPAWLHVIGTDIGSDFGEAITVRTVEAVSSSWEIGLAAARGYYEQNKHLLVHPDYVAPSGVRLGAWVKNMRAARRRWHMSAQRVKALDEIGMVWSPNQEHRARLFAMLRQFTEKNGHCDVPEACVVDGVRLGSQVRALRRVWKNGSLSAEEIAELQKIGFRKEVRPPSGWDRGLNACQEYYNANGNLRVPEGYRASDGMKLDAWLTKQRRHRREGRLTDAQSTALNELGMVWENSWERGVNACRAFYKANGHLRMPVKQMTPDGFGLGQWVMNRRKDKRDGRLTGEQIETLSKLGMVWENSWERGVNACRTFYEANGHLRIPPRYRSPDNLRLDRWVAGQRANRRTGHLTDEQIETLNSLGMIWDEYWERGLSACREHFEKHGHLTVSRNYRSSDGLALCPWLVKYRKLGRDGGLTAQQIADLDAVGIIWATPRYPMTRPTPLESETADAVPGEPADQALASHRKLRLPLKKGALSINA